MRSLESIKKNVTTTKVKNTVTIIKIKKDSGQYMAQALIDGDYIIVSGTYGELKKYFRKEYGMEIINSGNLYFGYTGEIYGFGHCYGGTVIINEKNRTLIKFIEHKEAAEKIRKAHKIMNDRFQK